MYMNWLLGICVLYLLVKLFLIVHPIHIYEVSSSAMLVKEK